MSDRTQPYVPGTLVNQWAAETDALAKKLRRELTCPNCGGLMVYGTPCGPDPHATESGSSSSSK